jgi:hypothetical protein
LYAVQGATRRSLPVHVQHRRSSCCAPPGVSRRRRQVSDSIEPVPSVAIFRPEFCHQPRPLTVVRRPNAAPEQDQAAVAFADAKHLAGMPRQRRPIEGHEHQAGFPARHQQRRVVQAKPGSVLPPCDMHYGKSRKQSRAGRDESMRRVLVSEQPRLCGFLRHAQSGFPRGRQPRMRGLA